MSDNNNNNDGNISAALPNPNHLDTIRHNKNSSNSNPDLSHTASNSNLRPHTYHGRIKTKQSTKTDLRVSAQPTPAPSQEIQPAKELDLAKTDDVALLKQEILNLRRKTAIYREERDSLAAILAIEKDFVRDRQNKLDSWEHFARLSVFKVGHLPF